MFIYHFQDQLDNIESKVPFLGNKGVNLIKMKAMGIPVPDCFVIDSRLCGIYLKDSSSISIEILDSIKSAIKKIELSSGLKFGSPEKPLLFSVRSGSQISMPGMMDTVLNLGMNDKIADGLAKYTNNKRFALDTYRRFLQMYGNVIKNIPHYIFDNILHNIKHKAGVVLDSSLDIESLMLVISKFKNAIYNNTGNKIPEDVYEQLTEAIKAVFKSWNNARAIKYREIKNIPDNIYTAITIQMMVYGNINNNSATGVLFSRNPATGEKSIFGEYLLNAQGEDVVAGTRDTIPITSSSNDRKNTLEYVMPNVFSQLKQITNKLEAYYKDMQDIEFTIQDGKLYILQTRSGKRSINAAIKIAVDMVMEGLINKTKALTSIEPKDLDSILHPVLDQKVKKNVLCTGLAASPGAACGKIALSSKNISNPNENYILVRKETSPEDIEGMNIACGILTTRGGVTSHAAVVTRGMGKPCVCGASSIIINQSEKYLSIGELKIKEGDTITIDGSTGEIMLDAIKMVQPQLSENFFILLQWAKENSQLKVYANADSAHDISVALKMGADGIGLCRTEHMFFASDRIPYLRQAIIAKEESLQKLANAKILSIQKEDFCKMFKAANGKPLNIRLLDPPLHEFMPKDQEGIDNLAVLCNESVQKINIKIDALQESNPMLGNRGCRLGILNPSIYITQINAIFEAAIIVYKEGISINPGIMIPLISTEHEVLTILAYINEAHANIKNKYGIDIKHRIGVMIELPRAALKASKIAPLVDFFSFGTNDLTQTVYGFSRDDTAETVKKYLEFNIMDFNPFIKLDEDGVGALITMAAENGWLTNHNLEVGICGEHGGNSETIEFLIKNRMHYTSCSPYRIPIMIISTAVKILKKNW
ncbi:Pyruvate, phosphate dikinase [Candidatus Xenohaliotis californiensis]|uniref:Pyruvate, phosphate dikinase n=1 Tax=Candidatus Xenohaliotis californiensis TaxID=84677 RepID=A0ABP0EVZ0_9RICK|nr:Pyruvate, phosphate dikinase [Candidatus Xenohaliotis californiensis]